MKKLIDKFSKGNGAKVVSRSHIVRMKQKIQDFFDGREVKYIKKKEKEQEEEVKESYIKKNQNKIVTNFRGTMVSGSGGSLLGPTASSMSNDRHKKQVIKKCKNIRETFKEAIENIADKLFSLIRSRI